jgi:hypothetical protein
MNVSDYAIMDTQELTINGANALECNNAKPDSFKQGNTVLCRQISVWLGWQFSKVEANMLTWKSASQCSAAVFCHNL